MTTISPIIWLMIFIGATVFLLFVFLGIVYGSLIDDTGEVIQDDERIVPK